MARSNGQQLNGDLYFLDIKGQKPGEKVYFRQAKAIPDGGVQKIEDDSIREVSGNINSLEFRQENYEGEVKDNVIIYLRDSAVNETYRLKIGFTSLGRSIFNTLLSLDTTPGKISISVYNRKKDGYASAFIKNNETQLSWKYSIDKLNEYIDRVPGKKKKNEKGELVATEDRDVSRLNEFLLNEMKAWAEKNIKKQEAHQQPQDVLPLGDIGTDDLPF